MNPRRVLITGAGSISSIGRSVREFWKAITDSRSGINPLTLEPGQHLSFSSAAHIHAFDVASLLPAAITATTDRSSQLGLVAAQEAVEHSGFLRHYVPSDIGVFMGCSVGGRTVDEPAVAKLYNEGGRVHPFTIPRVMASSGASHISMQHAITGPVLNFSTACASSAHAIGQAFHMIRNGTISACLAGGHEAALTYGFLKAWESLRVVSPTSCRPFSVDRDGMTLGEGAAVLVLEEHSSAMARGATPLAEIIGFGMSSDASHITQPQASGAASAIRNAIRDASIQAEDVGYINAHGTGTFANDKTEARAINDVFGDRAKDISVSSTKGLHGHCIGAAGAVEALATILALHNDALPINAGTYAADESLGLNLVELASIRAPKVALSNSFAFGGLNAVLAFRKVSIFDAS